MKGFLFWRNGLHAWVKFQSAALSSLIQNAISVKITKPPTPYNPHMGLALDARLNKRFLFFLSPNDLSGHGVPFVRQ